MRPPSGASDARHDASARPAKRAAAGRRGARARNTAGAPAAAAPAGDPEEPHGNAPFAPGEQLVSYINVVTRQLVSVEEARLTCPPYTDGSSKDRRYRCDRPHVFPGYKGKFGLTNLKYRAARDTHHSGRCQRKGSRAARNTPRMQRRRRALQDPLDVPKPEPVDVPPHGDLGLVPPPPPPPQQQQPYDVPDGALLHPGPTELVFPVDAADFDALLCQPIPPGQPGEVAPGPSQHAGGTIDDLTSGSSWHSGISNALGGSFARPLDAPEGSVSLPSSSDIFTSTMPMIPFHDLPPHQLQQQQQATSQDGKQEEEAQHVPRPNHAIPSSALNSMELPIHELSVNEMAKLVVEMFRRLGLLDAFKIDVDALNALAQSVLSESPDLPYHNGVKTFSVVHTCFVLVTSFSSVQLPPLHKFALMLAAMGQNCGHLGFTASFLVATRNYALVHRGTDSPYEQYHFAKYLDAIQPFSVKILGELDMTSLERLDRMLRALIVSTDATKHASLIANARAASVLISSKDNNNNRNAWMPDFLRSLTAAGCSDSSYQTLAALILNIADLGDSLRPWRIYQPLVKHKFVEYSNQALVEKELKIPHSAEIAAASSVNHLIVHEKMFLRSEVLPMLEVLIGIAPELSHFIESVVMNVNMIMIVHANANDLAVTVPVKSGR